QPLDEECEGDDVHDVEEAAVLQEGGGERRPHHANPSPPSGCAASPRSMSICFVGVSLAPAWASARRASADPACLPAPSPSPAPLGFGLDLNISSMRSVTRKPPTMLIVPKVIAITRIALLNAPLPERPTTSRAPSSTMPWIALVPDISGVCSVLGTLEMTTKPMNPASTRIARFFVRMLATIMRRPPPSSAR